MIEQRDGITWQTALLLAGLSYRGGIAHGPLVRPELQKGLADLAAGWELVWGPGTSHVLGDPLDACAMYVVRHRQHRNQYVVAVRGTNPLSISDWTLGDFNVGTKVAWPFERGAAVSTSTAFGLRWLLRLRWSPLSVLEADVTDRLSEVRLPSELLDVIRGVTGRSQRHEDILLGPIEAWLEAKLSRVIGDRNVPGVAGRALATVAVRSGDLDMASARDGASGRGLVSFLEQEASHGAALDVVVTGHSKGGALAPALALWLHQTRSGIGGWDRSGGSTVGCCAFAGPAPGDDGFAALLGRELGDRMWRVYNRNDIVTHAWDDAGLRSIPALYGRRTSELETAIEAVCDDLDRVTPPLGYAQPTRPAIREQSFDGRLDDARTFGAEFVHQHMDAYLDHARYDRPIDAITLFVG